MALAQCPCGGTPVLSISENRRHRRQLAQANFAKAIEMRDKPSDPKALLQKVMAATKDLQSNDPQVVENAKKTIADAELASLGTRRGYEIAERELNALQGDVVEVRCPTCNTFLWHADPNHLDLSNPTKDGFEKTALDRANFYAEGTWNRTVEKNGNLKPCCTSATDRRTDPDGMVIVHCDQCGLRHLAFNQPA